jgi:hypothetical protein
MLTADSDQPQPLDLLAEAGKMDWANKRLLGNPLGNPAMKTALGTTVAAKPRVLALVVEPDMVAWTTNMIEMWLGKTHHLEVKVKRGRQAVYLLTVTIAPRH